MKTISLPVISLSIFLSWLVPYNSEAQPVQHLQAQITAVEANPGQEEVLRIFGTAAGPEFSGFRLEFGVGEFPEAWRPLAQSSSPVSNDLLAEWKTAELPSGTYALRLTVKGRSGESLSDRAVIDLHELRPDLIIRRMEARVQGVQVFITGTVENQGKYPVRKPFSVDFYLSLHSTMDASAIHLGSSQFSPMEAGGSLPLDAHFLISPQIRDGSYFLLARADAKDEVVEADEDNNLTTTQGLIHLAPDLVITELKSALVEEERQITITGKIKNQGNRPAGKEFNLAIFLSANGSVDNRAIRIAIQEVEGLAAGAVTFFNLNASLPETLEPGNYFVLAQLDPEEKIYEPDKSNNLYWGSSLTVGPDLAMTHLSTTLSKDGRQIMINDSVKNLGRYPARQPFVISYYLVSSSGRLPPTERFLGSREVLSLPVGETSSASTSLPIGLIPKGTYVVLARADPEKTVLDINRANNESKSNEIQMGPDLAITTLVATLLPNGEQAEIQDTIKNQGTLPVTDLFQVAFYLSVGDRLDSSARLLGSRSVHGLEVGAESSGKTLVSLPPQTEPARAFVLTKVDPEGIIGEMRTDNNIASAGRLLTTDVDLVVGQLTATLTPDGHRMVINDTVKNLGPQDISESFSVAFYLSRDGVLDSEDLLLGERRVEGLKAGISSTGTTTLNIPENAGVGKLSVLARVDSRNEVIERKETNNDYWGSSVNLGPDLILTDLNGKVAPDGHEIVITQIVKNQGNRATPAGFKVGTYLSRDSTLSPDDLLLGTQRVPPLAPSEVATVRSAFPIPSSLENGRYVLLGWADLDREVREVEEANNDRVGGNILLGPDLVVEAVKSILAPEGDSITVEDTIRNQGNRPASGNLEVSYFLSKNWSIDESDIFLGSRVISQLGPGEASSASTILSIPKKKISTGRYFILARVDGGASVIETDKTNNVRPTLIPLIIRHEKEKRQ